MTATKMRFDSDLIDYGSADHLEILPDPVRPAVASPGPSRRRPGRTALAVFIWFVIGFLVWCILLSALPYARHQQGLDRRLRSELSQGLTPVNQPIAAGSPIARIQIGAVGLDATVVEGSEARQLVSGPGHLRTSVLPGQTGVSVLLGRRVTNGAPFRRINELQPGDRIRVTNGQGRWKYRVVRTRTVPATDASAFVATGNTLLLVTAERTAFGPGRLVVTARADGDLAQTGTRTQRGPATASELGLQGDATGVAGLLVWLQVLVLAAAGAIVLQRRWGRWPAWLLAAPVLGASLWALYEYLALLLPASF